MLNECNGCEYQCNLSHIDICTLGSPCPHQRSTPMTNEEWFCSLSTTEKAEFLSTMAKKAESISWWDDWLKEKHESEGSDVSVH